MENDESSQDQVEDSEPAKTEAETSDDAEAAVEKEAEGDEQNEDATTADGDAIEATQADGPACLEAELKESAEAGHTPAAEDETHPPSQANEEVVSDAETTQASEAEDRIVSEAETEEPGDAIEQAPTPAQEPFMSGQADLADLSAQQLRYANTLANRTPDSEYSGRMVRERSGSAASAVSEVSDDIPVQPAPLVADWVYGINCDIPIQSLTLDRKKSPQLVYAAGHIVIVYDYQKNTQKLLCVHRNDITCVVVSSCQDWIVTADSGQYDAILNIWDSRSRELVRTYFCPHHRGAVAAAMSESSEILVSIGGNKPQTLNVYKWSETEQTEASVTVDLPKESDIQKSVAFFPKDKCHFITWSANSVIFHALDLEKCAVQSRRRAVDSKKFNRVVGSMTGNVFDAAGGQLLSSTTEGNVIIWMPLDESDMSAHPMMRMEAHKLVHLSGSSINCIGFSHQLLVTGTDDGKVSFFGDDMKLRYWYDQIKEGAVSSITFSQEKLLTHGQAYPADASKMARRFVIPEFFVCTLKNVIAKCSPLGRGKFEVLLRDHPSPVDCVVAHPFLSRIFTGSHSGYLKMTDYKRRVPLLDKQLSAGGKLLVMAMDPTAEFMAAGFSDGSVQVLAAIDLSDQSILFRMSKGAIQEIAFSHDGQYMATADADRCVVVYRRPVTVDDAELDEDSAEEHGDNIKQTISASSLKSSGSYADRGKRAGGGGSSAAGVGGIVPQQWSYLGKYRSHYKPIRGILFGVNEETLEPRLFSLGADQVLVEYDLADSVEDDLRILTSDRIEQHAIPTCLAWYPRFSKELFFITANSEYKLKLYNPSTKMTRYTFQAMSCLDPIDKIVFLPLTEHEEFSNDGLQQTGYMAYAAGDVIGLALCPLDGNPYRYHRYIGHPSGVACMTASHDGEYIFTAGGADRSVIMHRVHRDIMDATVRVGGTGITPFYQCLPQGQRETVWFDKLMDYFYLIQLQVQGADTQEKREVGQTIPTSEIPLLMRAIGFYPTEYQIINILNEVKFSTYSQTGYYKEKVELEDVIRLYINHRPLVGSTPFHVTNSFHVIDAGRDGEGSTAPGDIATSELVQLLQERGEHLTEAELAEHMCYLFCSPSDYLQLPDDYQPGDAIHTSQEPVGEMLDVGEIIRRVPKDMNPDTFMARFLDMASA